MKKLLISFFILVGCGVDATAPQAQASPLVANCSMKTLVRVHEITFTRYLEAFQRDIRQRGLGCYPTYSMYFDEELPENMAGYCVPGDRVVINKKMWQTMTSMEKWVLIYHELGHCALGLDHLTEKDHDIMNPFLLPDHVSRPFWEDMKERMFDAARVQQNQFGDLP